MYFSTLEYKLYIQRDLYTDIWRREKRKRNGEGTESKGRSLHEEMNYRRDHELKQEGDGWERHCRGGSTGS